MLGDRFFLWPYKGVELEPAVEEIKQLLCVSDVAKYLDAPGGDLAEYIALQCRIWNINPWWLMISAQREQSALQEGGWSEKHEAAWLGVVGQDVGRVTLPGYYGIYTQVVRACEVTAWLLGVEPSTKWPEYWRTRKTSPRYALGRRLKVEGAPTMKDGKTVPGTPGVWVDYLPLSRGEFAQLAYTPHYGVLALNEGLARRWAPQKYLS